MFDSYVLLFNLRSAQVPGGLGRNFDSHTDTTVSETEWCGKQKTSWEADRETGGERADWLEPPGSRMITLYTRDKRQIIPAEGQTKDFFNL